MYSVTADTEASKRSYAITLLPYVTDHMTCERDQSWGLTVGQGGSAQVTLLVLGWILVSSLRMY